LINHAIHSQSYRQGVRKFLIEGVQAAGRDALALKFKHSCTEIMTGAVLSQGCNTVIPIENVEISDGKARVKNNLSIKPFNYVRRQGADHRQGKLLLKKGMVLKPVHIAIAAGVGKAQIKVSAKPRIAIVASGDELVNIDQPIKPYQIRRSNSYFIQAALEREGLFKTSIFHFPDDEKVLRKQLGALLFEFDGIVLTGGVSMGKFDYIPKVLKDLKVQVLFHKVKQRPGKPFWFGMYKHKKPVFALPGNPISTQAGVYRYVIPHWLTALGASEKKEYAQITKNISLPSVWTCFLPVKLKVSPQGVFLAEPIATGGSGDFAALGAAGGFMEIPANTQKLKSTFVGRVYRW